LTGDRKFSRLGDFMPGAGFPRSPQDTRKTQDTPIPAVLGKTLTDYKKTVFFLFFWLFPLDKPDIPVMLRSKTDHPFNQTI